MDAIKTFECTLDTVKEIRGWISGILSAHHTPQDVVGDVILAASEAVTNSLVHGYAETHRGRVDLRIQVSNGSILITVRDYGSGLGRTPYVVPDTSVPHEGGYGVYLVRSLMDEVEVLSADPGTEVRMKKLLKPGAGL